jgi:ATP-dependent protease HslVU (ClpYQ) ATPase subunit
MNNKAIIDQWIKNLGIPVEQQESGDPTIGKSEISRQLAKELNIPIIEIKISKQE